MMLVPFWARQGDMAAARSWPADPPRSKSAAPPETEPKAESIDQDGSSSSGAGGKAGQG